MFMKQESNICPWTKKHEPLTAPLRYGGGSANMSISAINKQYVFRRVSASNPPQRKAANRYSNMKDETQSYKVTLGHLSALFPEATAIGFGAVDIYNIDAQRPYSNSGKSSLFDINTCYNDEDNLHPFEIQGVTGPTPNDPECAGLTGGAICVTVPANSFGYFTIPVYTSTREALVLHDDQLFIYPNPASQAFLLECTLPTEILNDFILDLYNLNGEHKMTVYTQQHVPISIANLPSGVYMVAISNNQKSFTITKKFVKIE